MYATSISPTIRGEKPIRPGSGAIHDAQIFAKIMPAAMMFAPSIGGISHHYLEDTREDDIVLGCEVFCRAVAMIVNTAAATNSADTATSSSGAHENVLSKLATARNE